MKNNKQKMSILKKDKNNKGKNKKVDKTEDVKLSRVFYHYWKFVEKYKWWYLLLAFGLAVGQGSFMVGTPYFSKKLIDAMNARNGINEIWLNFWIIVLLFLISSVFLRLSTILAIQVYIKNLVDLHNYVFKKTINHSNSFFENNFIGALVNKLNKFVRAFEEVLDIILYKLLVVSSQIIFSIIIMFFINFKIGLIFFSWFIIYILVTIWFSRKKLILHFEKSKLASKRTGILADVLANVFNLKIFTAKDNEIVGYRKIVDKSAIATVKSWNMGNYQEITSAILFLILEILVIGYALRLWFVGKITIGGVVLIQSYFALFLSSLWSIGSVLRKLIVSISDAKEMVAILDKDIEVQDIKGAKDLKIDKGKIVFDQAVFSYPNQKENVFNKFTLTIPAGQTVGLVGTSGAGKTTITKLLLRFIDLDSGKIKIDNQNIAKVTQDSLRNAIAYVPQEPVLFHRSIYENIAYANPKATKKEVLEASKKAHVDEFVQTLEQGYDTMVGERGVKLSGGQKQRVAIARAFLKNAPILVLDEATSALDSISEELIQDALFRLMENKTVIVVAHRLSTVQRLDRILVIEEGEIMEDGNHEELLQKDGLYKTFWDRQTRRFA